MRFLATFQIYDFLDTLISLFTAFFLGTLIGAERQYRQRTAGLRTNVLVAVGAAAFVDLAMHLTAADGAVRVIAYVVSGIGFLGAGVIMKEGMNVRGLNTAATLWGSAAVGCCAGADMIAQAIALTAFVLAGNTLLRPLVNAINRSPLDERSSEATYYFKLAVTPEALPGMRDRLVERLERAKYPVADLEIVELGDDLLEIVATLVSTAIVPGDLDSVVNDLQRDLAFVTPPGKSAPRINAAFLIAVRQVNDREPLLAAAVGLANKFAVKEHVSGRQETHSQGGYVAGRRHGGGRPCHNRPFGGPAQGEQSASADGAGDTAAAVDAGRGKQAFCAGRAGHDRDAAKRNSPAARASRYGRAEGRRRPRAAARAG